MKLAIVHDFLCQYGGAEKCIEAIHDIYPEAPIFTTVYLPDRLPDNFKKMDIRTTFMQYLPFMHKHFKKYLLLYPTAVASMDLRKYDVILSSSSAFAKGAVKDRNACHISYCYSPMRFVWNYLRYIEKETMHPLLKKILPYCISGLKRWDLERNAGVDYFISISNYIRERIRNCYNRDSDVIYPPVNVTSFYSSDSIDDYFLVVSRLNAYKRIELVIEAFNTLQLPLHIVGEGPYRTTLERMAGPTVKFMGKLDEKELINHYAHCRAFIFPGDEDFGIAPVESQAAGRPVIAFASGGALETVIDSVTGIFFKEPTTSSLCAAIRTFIEKEPEFDPAIIRNNALRFDEKIFKQAIRNYVAEKYANLKR